MEIIAKIVGPLHPCVTVPMLSLASTLRHLGLFEKAEQLALEALQIREKEFGEDSVEVGKSLLLAFKSNLMINRFKLLNSKNHSIVSRVRNGS